MSEDSKAKRPSAEISEPSPSAKKHKPDDIKIDLDQEAQAIRDKHPNLCADANNEQDRQDKFETALRAVMELDEKILWREFKNMDLCERADQESDSESDEEEEDSFDWFHMLGDHEIGVETLNQLCSFLFCAKRMGCGEDLELDKRAEAARQAYLKRIKAKYRHPQDFAKRVGLTCKSELPTDGLINFVSIINNDEYEANPNIETEDMGLKWL